MHPLSAMKVHSKSRTKKIIAATWIIPIILTTPFLWFKSEVYKFESEYGVISRQSCTDRFNEIDGGTGVFRKSFYTVLFVTMYLIPALVILGTCFRITISLLQPILTNDLLNQEADSETKRRQENSKRKVSIRLIMIPVRYRFCIKE